MRRRTGAGGYRPTAQEFLLYSPAVGAALWIVTIALVYGVVLTG